MTPADRSSSSTNSAQILLRHDELLTSGELGDRLTADGRTATAARQQMARAARRNGIWRSSSLQLPGRERLFAQKSFVGTPEFLAAAEAVLVKTRPGLARCISAIRKRQVLLRPEAERLLAVRTTDEYRRAARALGEIGLATSVDAGTALERLAVPFADDSRGAARKRYRQIAASVQIARFVVEHLRRQSIVSWGGSAVARGPSQAARFGGYPFTATGWSWLRPVVSWNQTKPQPAPVLIDICASECDVFDVEALLARHERVRGVTHRNSPMLCVMAAHHFTRAALRQAQNSGFLTISLRQVFGDAALSLMAEISVLLNRESELDGDPEPSQQIESIAADLERLTEHPFVADLRSLGLEALSALIARTAPWDDVQVGITVPFGKNLSREVDVFGKREGGRKVLLVECKAHHATKPIDPQDVRRFFTETVPAFLKANHDTGILECQAEMWTTGIVGPDAESALSDLSLASSVRPALISGAELERRIPASIGRCRKLLHTIAASASS